MHLRTSDVAGPALLAIVLVAFIVAIVTLGAAGWA